MSYTARLKIFCDDKRILNMATYRYINQSRNITISDNFDKNYCTKVYNCYKGERVIFQILVNNEVLFNVHTPVLYNGEFNQSTYKIPATNAQTKPIKENAIRSVNVKNKLEIELEKLEGAALYFGNNFLIHDAKLRTTYIEQTKLMSKRYLQLVKDGKITVEQAAKEASVLRNEIMDATRKKLSAISLAKSQKEKMASKNLSQFLEYYAMKLKKPREFNRLKSISRKAIDDAVKSSADTPNSYFRQLNSAERNTVFYSVLKGSGDSNPKFNSSVKWMSAFGKVLVVFAVAFASYEIYNADNKELELYRQSIGIGSGMVGGAAGGAIASGICGPGSPICAIVGVIIGGVAGGYGAYVMLEAFDEELKAFTSWTVF